MKFLTVAAIAFAFLSPADIAVAAADSDARAKEWNEPNASSRTRYERCIAKTFIDPENAVLDAREWYISERADAARHCEAKALIELDQFTDAAALLSELALTTPASETGIKGALFAQAGNAWLLANDGEAALAAFDAAMLLLPGDPELLLDRARSHAELGNFDRAIFDLNASLAIDPLNPEAYVFRSSARQVLEFHDEAAEDISRALELSPEHPAALLERANLALTRNQPEDAKRDLLMVIKLAPDTSLSRVARQKLEPLLY